VRVGVLSGPGRCTKSRHYRYRHNKPSPKASDSHQTSDTAAAVANDNGLLAVPVMLPNQVGSASSVRKHFVVTSVN